ncbi:extracellular solute-binding protein [Paenibacillus wynnii]|uniref:PI-PLC Y-box domain-containing protein n=1 Tax=Paenibacillus wynnii TaxID=268407 RepID=A0A098M891_9BACL|nr:extracellular solute-binding protein [Paenibacillus wynnii]KGE18789.1 hypothetical protein PWYN_04955 [Paenibacillus wynnii]
MKNRKAIFHIITLSLAFSMLLSACGNSNNGSKTEGNNPAPEGNTTKETNAGTNATDVSKLEAREISIYFEGPPAQKDTQLVEEAINKITKAKINATVKIHHLGWAEFPQKMNLMMASGEPFDLMFTAGWDNFTGNVAKGAFIQLDDPNNNLLESYGKGILETMDPVLLNGGKLGGKTYAIPTQKEIASQWGMLLQKELVDKYKIDLTSIKKLEDLEPYLLQVKKDYPNIIPIIATKNWLYNLPYEIVGSQESPGRLPTDGSTKIVNIFETEEAKSQYMLMEKWFKLGLFQKDPATNTDLGAQSKTGLVFAQQAQLKPGGDAEYSIGMAKPFVQSAQTEPRTSPGDLNNSMLAISKTSKDPERAMMFLNLLHTDKEIVNLIDYGIEGKHYVKVPGKETVIKYPDGVEASQNGYAPANAWQIGNQFLTNTFEQEDPQKWEKFKDFNHSSTPSVLVGFVYNAEPVKNEEAAIAAIWKKYVDALGAGIVDSTDYLDKMNKELKKAGMDKVLQEKQRQIDEFLATKK